MDRPKQKRLRHLRLSIHCNQDGSTSILEMGTDITDRNRAKNDLKKYQEHLEQLVAERTEALRRSEERWATTLSSIGDAVIATDTEGKITFLNPVAEELTGWTLSEAKQKPVTQIFNIVNEQTRKTVESPVTKVLEKGLDRRLSQPHSSNTKRRNRSAHRRQWSTHRN